MKLASPLVARLVLPHEAGEGMAILGQWMLDVVNAEQIGFTVFDGAPSMSNPLITFDDDGHITVAPH